MFVNRPLFKGDYIGCQNNFPDRSAEHLPSARLLEAGRPGADGFQPFNLPRRCPALQSHDIVPEIYFGNRSNRTKHEHHSRNDAVEFAPHPGPLPVRRGEGEDFSASLAPA